jgi:hypothetical protein
MMMLKWFHVLVIVTGTGTGTEIETETGNGYARGKEKEKGKGKEKETGIKAGRGRGPERGTGIAIAIGIVPQGVMVAGWALQQLRVVEGAQERWPVVLTTAIGRWRREWDSESLNFFLAINGGHLSVSQCLSKDYAMSTYTVSGMNSYRCIYIHM